VRACIGEYENHAQPCTESHSVTGGAFQPTYAERLRLAAAFIDAAEAGYGLWDGERFEAYPGMADAAADHIGQILGVQPFDHRRSGHDGRSSTART
jgi:hypothetical protein